MTQYAWRTGATAHPEDSVLQFMTDWIDLGGVASLVDNHYKVSEDTGLNMNIQIASGRAYLKTSSGNCYPIRNTATATETISANSSGNDRIDAVVVYVNKSTSPNTDASNIVVFAIVEGTPAASPSAPTDGDISTAIGSSNPYERLANILVGNGVSAITDSDITDTRKPFQFRSNQTLLSEVGTAPSTPSSGEGLFYLDSNGKFHKLNDSGKDFFMSDETWYQLTDATTIDIDCSLSRMFEVPEMAGNRTLTLSNVVVGKKVFIKLGQDGTGSRTPTFPTQTNTFETSDVNTASDQITVDADIPTGTPVQFSSAGTLPAGLSAATTYYAINVSSTVIQVASSLANARAGTAVTITDTGSGQHTFISLIKWVGGEVPTVDGGSYSKDTFMIDFVSTYVMEGYIVGDGII